MPETSQLSTQENPPANVDEESGGAPEPVKFPWGMFCLAIIFDIIGIIPFLNFFTEALAGLTFGFWQKMYAPKTDPIMTFIIAKIIKFIGLGILPDNIGIVIYAYIKKKLAAKLKTPLGQKLAGQTAK